MKQLSKNLALVVLLLTIGQQAFSYDFKIDGIFYNYNIEDGTAIVTSEYEGGSTSRSYSGDIVIPESVSINGRSLRVTAVWHHTFWDCDELKSVTLPETIMSIGYEAFSECDMLETVNIPSNIKSVGEEAFYNCKNLAINAIPESIEEIGDRAFGGCSGFTSLNFPNNISIGNGAFSGCRDLEQITVYRGKIGQYAFASCTNLKQVNILKEVSSIGSYVLQNCSEDVSVFVEDSPNSLEISTQLGDYLSRAGDIGHLYMGRNGVFWGYNRLKTLGIGSNITSIDLKYVTSLEIIFSMFTNPETCNANFSTNTYVNAKLIVPIGCKEKYMASKGWKDFFVIEEMDVADMWNGQGEPNINDNPQQQKCEKPIIHYSNGKLSFECATDGATCQSTITDTDIASYSENEIQLSVTYNISVYASKAGFGNSETVTATLCWIDADPKTEGIETGVAQVRANAVLIQSHDGTVSVEGVADGTDITIYDTSGQMVGSTKAHCNYTTIATNVRNGSVAIVRIGDKSVKIMMK